MSQIKKPLVKLCYPLFRSLKRLQSDEAETLSLQFGETLYRDMIALDHCALEQQVPVQQLDDIKFALAALLDEAIMKSKWPGKSAWVDQSLQWRLFGEHLAGINFYTRLTRIRQNPEVNLSVMELYFTCLQLGFQGKYAVGQLEELKALQVDLKHQIDLHHSAFDSCLSYDKNDKELETSHSRNRIPEWVWIGIVCGFIAVLYLIYGLRNNQLQHDYNSQLDEVIHHYRTL